MAFINYKVKEHLFSFSPRYTVTDDHDSLIAKIDKPGFSFIRRGVYYDQDEQALFEITNKLFSFYPTFFIKVDQRPIFKIFKTWGFKPSIFVESLTEPDAFLIQGNIWSSEYAFYKNDIEFAFVTRNIWRIADVYRVAIKEDEPQHLILALVIVVDMIYNRRKK